MAASLWTTGPALIYCGVNSGQTGSSSGSVVSGQYLGTSERAPKIRIYHTYKEIFNDLGGRKVPFDKQWQGDYAVITAVLNRFDYSVYEDCAEVIAGNSTPGNQEVNILGSIMGQEGLYQQVYVKFPYQSVTQFSGQPAGYRFPAATFEGPDDFVIGVEDTKIAVMWVAIRAYNPAAGTAILYDNNVSGLPSPT